jgi:hypothetical protein
MPYAIVSPSLLLQNGECFIYGKEQMGHSSINVTVEIYGHLIPGGNRQAVDKLEDGLPTVAKKQRTTKLQIKSGNSCKED